MLCVNNFVIRILWKIKLYYLPRRIYYDLILERVVFIYSVCLKLQHLFPKMSSSSDSELNKEILYINFNQTSQALTVGSRTGYTLYDLQSVHECNPLFESRNLEDVCIIERNFNMNLVAYVKLDKPRNLILYNCSKGCVIKEKLFPNTVLSVKLNRHSVVVCLENHIYIINVWEMKDDKIHIIKDTASNTRGLIALSWGSSEKPSLLAYPASSITGDAQIFDAQTCQPKITIPAHASQLAALAFDEAVTKLATASIKGTVIRVFSILNGEVLFEFRRGVKRCAEINCLSFSRTLDLLCVSSNTETIHIFKLDSPNTADSVEAEEEAEGWMDMFGRVLTQSAKFLPTQMTDVLTQQRAFAYVHLPFVDQKTICAISQIDNRPYVLVASLEGFLYIYDFNVQTGGQCHLIRQFRLEGPKLCFVPTPQPSLKSPKTKYSSHPKSAQKSDCDRGDSAHRKADDGVEGCGPQLSPEIGCKEVFKSDLATSNGVHQDCAMPTVIGTWADTTSTTSDKLEPSAALIPNC